MTYSDDPVRDAERYMDECDQYSERLNSAVRDVFSDDDTMRTLIADLIDDDFLDNLVKLFQENKLNSRAIAYTRLAETIKAAAFHDAEEHLWNYLIIFFVGYSQAGPLQAVRK